MTNTDPATPLAGLVFVLAGTCEKHSRSELHDMIVKHGGTVEPNVTKRTSYLVVGERPGLKLAEAQRLGVGVFSETDLLKRIEIGTRIARNAIGVQPPSKPAPAGDWADKVTANIYEAFRIWSPAGPSNPGEIAQMIREAERADATSVRVQVLPVSEADERLVDKLGNVTDADIAKAKEALKRPHDIKIMETEQVSITDRLLCGAKINHKACVNTGAFRLTYYTGPDDRMVRYFCKEHLETVSRLEEARALKAHWPMPFVVAVNNDPEVTDPEELATVAREALRTAYLAAAAYRDGCHAGPCQVCSGGSGEVWTHEGSFSNPAKLLGTCLACNGHGVQDCSVEGCKKC